MPDQQILHGTCIEVGGQGVLVLGPPGAGKSDLALRLIDQPGAGLDGTLRQSRLVADDQVVLRCVNGRLIASAPAPLAGKLEVRGLGVVDLGYARAVELSLAVRLTQASTIERLPDSHRNGFEALGVSLPLVLIDPSAASAPARIRAALGWLAGR